MPTDEDVVMSNDTAITTAPQEPPSEPRRTDHDWEYYYLPSAPVQRMAPHSSQNLVSLYKLDDLMKSVRRTDPVTGEKINKLRKSYEGKVKTLHIAGVNKPVSSPGEFFSVAGKHLSEVPEDQGILNYTQEEWLSTKLGGRPIQQPSEDLLGKLDKALQMRPGVILEADKWKKIIGNDELPKAKISVDGAKGGVTQPATARNSPFLKASSSAVRPERAGAKRRYIDQTYSGYGEGLSDDVGDSTHEDERKSAHINKKRRKDNMGVASPLGGPPYNAPGVMAGGPRR